MLYCFSYWLAHCNSQNYPGCSFNYNHCFYGIDKLSPGKVIFITGVYTNVLFNLYNCFCSRVNRWWSSGKNHLIFMGWGIRIKFFVLDFFLLCVETFLTILFCFQPVLNFFHYTYKYENMTIIVTLKYLHKHILNFFNWCILPFIYSNVHPWFFYHMLPSCLFSNLILAPTPPINIKRLLP